MPIITNTRSGKAKGFRLYSVWDLDAVIPLFRVPSCVLFVEKRDKQRTIPVLGIKGLTFSGKLESFNSSFKTAYKLLTEETKTGYYVKQGSSTALSNKNIKISRKKISIKNFLRMVQQFILEHFILLSLTKGYQLTGMRRLINLKMDASVVAGAKYPWKEIRNKRPDRKLIPI